MRDGVPDRIDDARRFLSAEIGPRAEGVREAFLAAGPAALDYLEARHAETLAKVEHKADGPIRLLVAGRIGRTRLIDNVAV